MGTTHDNDQLQASALALHVTELMERNENQARTMQLLADKLNATKKVLEWREKELLDLKGPCSNKVCCLHYAHSGPCFMKVTRDE